MLFLYIESIESVETVFILSLDLQTKIVPKLMFSEVCNRNIVGEITSLLIDAAVTILVIIIAILSLYHMRNYHKNTQAFPSLLYVPQIIFYISNILFVIFLMITHFGECFDRFYAETWILMVLFYAIHWFSLLALLFFRLYCIFKQTAFPISSLYKIILLILVSIDTLLLLVVIYSGVISFNEIINSLSSATAVFIAICISQILSITFIYKLYQVNKMQDEIRQGLINMMTKYTIITIISVSISTLTVLLIIIQIFAVTENTQRIWNIFVWKGFLFDVFIDSISTSLSFQFYSDHYQIICKFCDMKCKKLCIQMASGKNDNFSKPTHSKVLSVTTTHQFVD